MSFSNVSVGVTKYTVHVNLYMGIEIAVNEPVIASLYIALQHGSERTECPTEM